MPTVDQLCVLAKINWLTRNKRAITSDRVIVLVTLKTPSKDFHDTLAAHQELHPIHCPVMIGGSPNGTIQGSCRSGGLLDSWVRCAVDHPSFLIFCLPMGIKLWGGIKGDGDPLCWRWLIRDWLFVLKN